jgi:hypothetical protein
VHSYYVQGSTLIPAALCAPEALICPQESTVSWLPTVQGTEHSNSDNQQHPLGLSHTAVDNLAALYICPAEGRFSASKAAAETNRQHVSYNPLDELTSVLKMASNTWGNCAHLGI